MDGLGPELKLMDSVGSNPAGFDAPLLHSVGGGGAWDEVIGIGLIVVLLAALGAFGYFSGRQKRKRRGGRSGKPARRP